MRRATLHTASILLLCIILSLVVGCSKLTPENYSKLKMSMPYDAVTEIIGAPDQCEAAMGIKDCTWGKEKKHINVKFLNDKVIFFTAQGI